MSADNAKEVLRHTSKPKRSKIRLKRSENRLPVFEKVEMLQKENATLRYSERYYREQCKELRAEKARFRQQLRSFGEVKEELLSTKREIRDLKDKLLKLSHNKGLGGAGSQKNEVFKKIFEKSLH